MVDSINRNRVSGDVQYQVDLNRKIADLNESIATGNRLSRPSDDSTAWLEITNIDKHLTDDAAWDRNIDRAKNIAGQAESSVDAIVNGLIRMRELMVSASNGTFAPEDRNVMALEVEGFGEEFAALLVQKDGYGGDLFSAGDAVKIPIDIDNSIVASPSKADLADNIAIGGGATASLSDIVTNAANAMRSSNGADRQTQLDALENAVTYMADQLAQMGVTGNRLETAQDRLAQKDISYQERRSELGETKIEEAITSMQSLMINLEAARSVYGRVNQSSLLDYL